MTRYRWAGVLAAGTSIVVATISPKAADDTPAPVTFAEDVLPILQRNCQ